MLFGSLADYQRVFMEVHQSKRKKKIEIYSNERGQIKNVLIRDNRSFRRCETSLWLPVHKIRFYRYFTTL